MIRLGLYGTGNRTKTLLDSLGGDGFYKVHAAYDRNRESAAALTAKYGGTVCRSADELADFEGVDAYFISLSPFAHAAGDSDGKTGFCGEAGFVFLCGSR